MPYISRSKDNHTMKFGQLIQYNMREVFLKNRTQNVVKKLVLNLFQKDQSWAYLWINSLKLYTVCLYCMPSWGLSKYIETNLQTTCFCFFIAFLKNKNRSEISFSSSFCAWKVFSCCILLIHQILLSGCFCFVRYCVIYRLKLLVNQAVTS